MFAAIEPSSTAAFAVLIFCFILVLAFEFSNGFHDTANAVATVIYTNSLKPGPAVVLSGVMNFLGVVLGGVAVAFTLVELLPPDVLTPPNGNPAIAMLLALFLAALLWNVTTWWMGIPCSSSHAIIGSLLGVAIVNSITAARGLGQGVDWSQVWAVLRALFVSPLLGFLLAGALFRILQAVIRDETLFEPTEGRPPPWWVRGLLILTCSGVSFAHGSNDGQKSIGLIMLTVIGIMPAAFSLNPEITAANLPGIIQAADQAVPLIQKYGDDEKDRAAEDAWRVSQILGGVKSMAEVPDTARPGLRDAVYHVNAALRMVSGNKAASAQEKAAAKQLHETLHGAVEYAPVWVRMLSAICLGLGTMIGYRRIVTTLGERIGKRHLTPAQGASAEVVGALLIGTAGFSGLPVSTTHIIASGVAGTMAGSGAGVQKAVVWQIIIAWVATLPATIVLSGGLFWIFSGG
ncbi:MAG: inorganic phosphate transporter, PiT family [Acetobacteraceae bacterium]|jgi:PiT family inorganic phosphate transporter|nr:inorganic phosphate transporter, PiT family [Acetobacteraceae bacterium]